MCLRVIDKLNPSGYGQANKRCCVVYDKTFTARRACISFCLHKETVYMTRGLTESNSTAVNSHALAAVDRFLSQSFSVFPSTEDASIDIICSSETATAARHLLMTGSSFRNVLFTCSLQLQARLRSGVETAINSFINFFYFFIKEQQLML